MLEDHEDIPTIAMSVCSLCKFPCGCTCRIIGGTLILVSLGCESVLFTLGTLGQSHILCQSISLSVDQSVGQSVSQLVSQPVSQLVS